jgi:hypothetical protein
MKDFFPSIWSKSFKEGGQPKRELLDPLLLLLFIKELLSSSPSIKSCRFFGDQSIWILFCALIDGFL